MVTVHQMWIVGLWLDMDEIQVNTIIPFLFIFSFSRKKCLSLLYGVDQFYLCIPTDCSKTSVNIAGLFFVFFKLMLLYMCLWVSF